MRNFKKFLSKRRALIVSLILALFLLFFAKKVYQYAAAPDREKACNFIFPRMVDQTKPTNIIMNVPDYNIVWQQKGGVINDASCLNQTSVYGIAKISSEEDVKNALQFARDNKLKVTSAGQRHSMGGQSFIKNGLVLNMRSFNKMKLDKENKIFNVQTGARWLEVQEFLDKQGLSVKAMQSINIFTVGGTLSVNAHGVAHEPGQIAPTVRSFRIMLSNGEIKTASLTENMELFRSALGGYGLFGVILDVDLEVVNNEIYELNTEYMNYKDFVKYYLEKIDGDGGVGLFYARLSVAPGEDYLTETAIHRYDKVVNDGTMIIPNLEPSDQDWMNRLIINFSKTGGFGRWTRWMLEKNIEPKIHKCISRNQAMSQKEVCLVSRNQEMYDSMGYLKNRLPDTDILQEYFITGDKVVEFIDGLRKVVQKNGANLLNVTIRIVHDDKVTALPYAKGDRFAFVLYFNQHFNEKESEILRKTTVDLIDMANEIGGTYYLPYQLFYSQEQLHKAYPEVDDFFEAKKKYDPEGLFSNKFYEKYGQ